MGKEREHKERELMAMLLEADLPLSVLLIAEGAETLELPDARMAVQALWLLGCLTRIRILVEERTSLLGDNTIALLYIRAGGQLELPAPATASVESCEHGCLCPASLRSYFTALTKKERVRRRLLLEAFRSDCRNIEALARLKGEGLCEAAEITALIDSAEIGESSGWEARDYRSFLRRILDGSAVPAGRILCPLTIGAFVPDQLALREYEPILTCAVSAADRFPEAADTYETLGLYYLLRRHHRRAQACFARAIEIDRHRGRLYLYNGIALAAARETEKAVAMLDMANAIMGSSILPAYALAFEFQQMNNFAKARFFYGRCLDAIAALHGIASPDAGAPLNIKRNKTAHAPPSLSPTQAAIVDRAVYCLIYNEDYERAMHYINLLGASTLLRVFCLLFTGEVEQAKRAIQDCPRDSAYHATSGFLHHISDDFEAATSDYNASIAICTNSVVTELLHMALSNIQGTAKNHAFEYTNSLFDSLEYKKRCMLIV